MTVFRSIFLLLMCIAFLAGSQFCASDGNDPVPTWDPSDQCNGQPVANITPPPIRNLSDATYTIHDCSIAVLLDLDQTFTSIDDYNNVLLFLKGMTNTCMERGVGYQTYFYSMFNSSIAPTICCGEVVCSHQIGFMNYYDFVGHYSSNETVQPETAVANFTYALLGEMKPFSQVKTRCLYNTVVMLTNRIFDYKKGLGGDVMNVVDYGCISFTIIGVGNPGITSELMSKYYDPLTTNQYVVPNSNCLPNLIDCIKPCGPRSASECQSAQQNLSHCRPPTTPLPTTTVPTTPSPTPTVDSRYVEYWHIIYLFALSNRTSQEQFQRAINYVQEPLQNCFDDSARVVVRFLAKNHSDSDWLSDTTSIHTHLESLHMDEILLDSSGAIDVYDNTTLQLVQWATSLTVNEDKGVDGPRLTLLTDFVSQNFIDAYNGDNSLIKSMEKFDFEIYCFDEKAADIYRNRTVIKATHIHSDPNFNDAQSDMIEICQAPAKKGSSVPTILIIIVGTCTGGMLLLIIATILYRQKYMWMEKLNRFKSNEAKDSQAEDDMIDYWELSWDKLIVKNERLGHGAYGQVFKGKLIGTAPAIQQYHRTEAALFTDCDCAVKMLPRHASENARAEFVHEISLMKSLGCHEHIVNMLGCITAGKSCLVMEYCNNRDLLRYLKQRKVELEISKSVDEQVECNKEFLNFAWQVARGMRFLGLRNIIHRDLAARNIMITGPDGMRTAKIGDFGLAMTATPTDNALSASGRLPIKWLALESLVKGTFSFKSDVWSYGVVLFETWSMGEIPFSDIEPTDLIAHLEDGNRPKRPLMATDKVAELMTSCWDKNPAMRPSFEDLQNTFAVILEQAAEGYGYLALIRSNEHYRVVAEIQYDTPPIEMDSLYAEEPSKTRSTSGESGHSKVSRIQIDANPHPRLDNSRMYPTITVEEVPFEEDEDEAEEGKPPRAGPSREANWADRMRRRKSQIAQLNPFKKIAQRKESNRKRRDSVNF